MSGARLEVLRRLEERRTPNDPRLRELVLATPVGGRGPVDDDGDGTRGGADRAQLRVCLAVLSRLCELAPATAPARHRRGWLRRRPTAPVVVGTSPQAEALRRAPGDRRADAAVTVVAAPLDAMAAGLWRRRVEAGSGVRWHRLWAGLVARDRLPVALDPASQARDWRQRVGADRVQVVVAGPGVGPDSLDAVDTDLLRRLNQVLATRPEPVRRRPYDGATGRDFDHPWTGEPGVPEDFLAWAVARGEQLADDLAGCGLPLLGDPALVVPSTDARIRRVPVAVTLERALDVVSVWLGREGDPWRAR